MSSEANQILTEAVSAKASLAQAQKAYGSQSRRTMEDKLIVDYLPLVKHIAYKIGVEILPGRDVDDMISAGTLGLVEAARRFDPSRDVDFKTFAYIRIRGAIIDDMRKQSFVPTTVRKQLKHIEAIYNRYTSANGQPPDDETLANELGIKTEQLYRTLQEARRQHFLSIHGLSDESAPLGSLSPISDDPSPDRQVERAELLENLTQSIEKLPEKSRVVLLLYYQRDLTMKEAAEVMGITESRVSQLHASALFKLSVKMKTMT